MMDKIEIISLVMVESCVKTFIEILSAIVVGIKWSYMTQC